MTREEAKEILTHNWTRVDNPNYSESELDEAFFMAIEALSAEAVQVVRCKDCKYKVVTEDGEYNPEDIVCDYWATDGLEETDFCSYGERKGGDTE